MSSSDSQCDVLLGFFGALMLLALTVLVLVCKSHLERKQGISSRKCQEFYMDVLKQVVGTFLLHILNLWIVFGDHSGTGLSLCHAYLIEIMMERSFGPLALLACFKLVSVGKNRWMTKEEADVFRHGKYYSHGAFELSRFYKQMLLWCACVIVTKLFMLCFIRFFLPILMPILRLYLWIAQVWPFCFMAVFPIIMHGFQIWMQDNFLQARKATNAPYYANYLDPVFCLPPNHELRGHLKPLITHMASICPQHFKGKGKGKGPSAPVKPKGGGKGKPAVVLPTRPPLPGPRPADGLNAKRNLKLHWKRISPEEISYAAGSTVWDKIRYNVTKGKTPELPGDDFEEVFMERKSAENKQGSVEDDDLTWCPLPVPSFGSPLDGPRKSWRRSIKAQLILDQQGAFNLNLAYKSLEQKSLNDVKTLDGVLGRREELAARAWSEVPAPENLEVLLKFLAISSRYEDVLTLDASSETPSEIFAIELVRDCGDFNVMIGRIQTLLAKRRLELTMDNLEAQYARIKDNVAHITNSSTKLPEILQHALQLGNYVNHGSSMGDAEAIDLNSLVRAFTTAKCKPTPDAKEVTVFQFLAQLLRQHRSSFWMEQLEQDLLLCCEAQDINPAELSHQLQKCKGDLEAIVSFAEAAGPEDPPTLSAEDLNAFTYAMDRRISKLAKDKLEKERAELLGYFALSDRTTTIPAVLENLAALRTALFAEGWKPQKPKLTKMHSSPTTLPTTRDLERASKADDKEEEEGAELQAPRTPRQKKRRSRKSVASPGTPGVPEVPVAEEIAKQPAEAQQSVEDWLRDNNFKDLNEPRIFFNPMATWIYPLHMAVMHKDPKVVKMLLDAYADPTKTNLTASARELTPLRLAKYYESSFSFTSRSSKGAYEPVIKVLEEAERERGLLDSLIEDV